MATYLFRVGTPDGSVVERRIDAPSMSSARSELQSEGLHIFEGRRTSLWSGGFGKVVTTERFLLFNQELLALVRAGLPIIQSLELMIDRQPPRFRQVLIEIRDEIRSGSSLSDAFASREDIFPPIYASSLRAGERSGDLPGVISRFLRYQRLVINLKKKVVQSLIYPSVLVAMMVGMIYVMLAFVVPRFTDFFTGFGKELPPLTQFMIAAAFFVRDNSLLFLVGAILLYFVHRRWTRTESGGILWDRFKLAIPFVGSVLKGFANMQFTQSLETLLSGGTPMINALETAAQSVSNRFVRKRILEIVPKVVEGGTLWGSLESTGVMSDISIEMIKVGEATGSLDEMLHHVGQFYDEEIERKLSRMMALLEPLILVVMALVIALLLYAFYLPLFELAGVQNA